MSDQLNLFLTIETIVLCSITTVLLVVGGVLLLRNFNSSMMRARHRALTLLIFLGSGTQSMVWAVFEAPSLQATYMVQVVDQQYSFPFILSFVMTPFMLKVALLYFKFELSAHLSQKLLEKVQQTEQMKRSRIFDIAEKSNWFVANRWLVFQNWPLICIYLTVSVIYFIPATFLWPKYTVPYLTLFHLSCMFTIVSLVILVMVKLRKKFDEWGIRQEIRLETMIGSVTATEWVIWRFLPRTKTGDVINYLVLWIGLTAFHFSAITYPLIKAELFKRARRRSDSLDHEGYQHEERLHMHLKQYLSDPERFKSFHRHLELEFSLENLLFCNDVWTFQSKVLEYKKDPTQDTKQEILEMALEIYMQYVPDNAPSVLNLSFPVRTKLKTNFTVLRSLLDPELVAKKTLSPSLSSGSETLSGRLIPSDLSMPVPNMQFEPISESKKSESRPPTLSEPLSDFSTVTSMFDQAEEKVMKMMESDSYARFKLKPEYHQSLTQNGMSINQSSETKKLLRDIMLE
jgi:hypothetical protein